MKKFHTCSAIYLVFALLVYFAVSPQNSFAQPNKTNTTTTAPPDTTLLLPIPELPVIEVTEGFETVYAKQGPVIKVNIPSADPILVEKSWLRYLKNFGGKTRGTKGEYLSDNASMRGVSEDPIKIYSKIEGNSNGAMLKLLIDMGGGNYVNPKTDEDKFTAIKKMLTNFAVSESIKGIRAKMEAEERQLLNLDKERNAHKRTEKEILGEIVSLRAAIEREEAKLNENQDDQNRLNLDIKKQINTIEYLKKSLKNVSQQQ